MVSLFLKGMVRLSRLRTDKPADIVFEISSMCVFHDRFSSIDTPRDFKQTVTVSVGWSLTLTVK